MVRIGLVGCLVGEFLGGFRLIVICVVLVISVWIWFEILICVDIFVGIIFSEIGVLDFCVI